MCHLYQKRYIMTKVKPPRKQMYNTGSTESNGQQADLKLKIKASMWASNRKQKLQG